MSKNGNNVSRRAFLAFAGYTGATAALAGLSVYLHNTYVMAASSRQEAQIKKALPAILEALDHYPLVALGEAHQLQQEHDFIQALLHHPALPEKIQDIVVEFGNARYQAIADRFVSGQPVADTELVQIWRNTLITGENPVWDAPVYEQFFRTVRAVNQGLPASRRLRVLLGDPPIDWSTVRKKEDWGNLALQRDSHYTSVVEREVLTRNHRALLIAGTNHFLRGIRADGDPTQPADRAPLNTGTRLEQTHPGKLYVIDLLIFPPDDKSAESQRIASWPYPSLVPLAGTWLGAETIANNDGKEVTTHAATADAMLYLGPGKDLTASRPDPSLYSGGDYARELERRGKLLIQWGFQDPGDPLKIARKTAKKGPAYFAE